jgi:hypothetical protein
MEAKPSRFGSGEESGSRPDGVHVSVAVGGATFTASGPTDAVREFFDDFKALLAAGVPSPPPIDQQADRPAAGTPPPAGPPLRIGEFARQLDLKGNPNRAAAIVVWSARYGDKAELSRGDIETLWRQTSWKKAGNLTRDIAQALRSGLLHREGAGNRSVYSATGLGEQQTDAARIAG